MQKVIKDFRNGYRATVDSFPVSEIIWDRLKPYISENQFSGMRCLGLNERMRFLRYDGGEYFKGHCDGQMYLPAMGS